MQQARDPTRRAILRACAMAAPLASLLAGRASGDAAADLPLLSEDDPLATAVHYTGDAARAADAKPGATCLTCSAYTGANNAPQGPCAILPGKAVKAAGWCSAWADM